MRKSNTLPETQITILPITHSTLLPLKQLHSQSLTHTFNKPINHSIVTQRYTTPHHTTPHNTTQHNTTQHNPYTNHLNQTITPSTHAHTNLHNQSTSVSITNTHILLPPNPRTHACSHTHTYTHTHTHTHKQTHSWPIISSIKFAQSTLELIHHTSHTQCTRACVYVRMSERLRDRVHCCVIASVRVYICSEYASVM